MRKTNKSKRQLVLEKAAVVFNSKGYSATSMKDIAEAVGLKPASLYNHISSKQEILSVLLLTIANRFDEGIKEVDGANASFKDKLGEIIRMHIRIATENQDITALIIQDWKHLEEPSFSEFIEIRKNYQNIFLNVLEQGMKAGQLKTANVQITLNVILSSLRWIYNSELYDNTSNLGLKELEKTILNIVFNGVGSK